MSFFLIGFLVFSVIITFFVYWFFNSIRDYFGKFFKKTASRWTLVFGTILVVVGIALLIHFDPKDLLSKVLFAGITEVGFAFIIAWVVGMTVEHGARQDYNDYIQQKEKLLSRNVFSYLYNNELPRPVFEFVEKHIFKASIIKSFQKVEYTIPDPPENSEWITMKCVFDYRLKNISEEKVSGFPLRFHISKPTTPDEPKDSIGTKYVRIREREFTEAEIVQMNTQEVDADGQIRYSKSIDIDASETVDVRIVFLQHKKIRDSDLFKHSMVCERTELVVRFDQSKYDFFAEPVSPHDQFDFTSSSNGHSGCFEAVMNMPMLPKNGFFIWWSPKETADDATLQK